MSLLSPKDIDQIKTFAAQMDTNNPAQGSFAAPHGSVSPDCCAEWTRSAWRLNVCVQHIGGMRSEPDASILFCPWCGRARPKEKLTDRREENQ